jgi:cysteine synthase
MAAFIPPVLDLSLLTEKARVTSKQAEGGTLALLHEEGIFAGLSSGAAVSYSIEMAKRMDSGNIVTILPDGGWKYLSMDFWTGRK